MQKKILLSVFFAFFFVFYSNTSKIQNIPMAQSFALEVIANQPLSTIVSFNVEHSMLASALLALYVATNDSVLLTYVQSYADKFVREDGTVQSLDQTTFDSKNIASGVFLFDLYNLTRDNKYLRAVSYIRNQLLRQPRNDERAFLRDAKSTDQLHLNTLFDICPFYTRYATIFDRTVIFNDVFVQFDVYDTVTLDAKSDLNFDAWSGTKEEKWANASSGMSNFVSAQGIAFYLLAMVETLEFYPINNRNRYRIVDNLNRVVKALAKKQDRKTGMWYQLLNESKNSGNLPDANASILIIYSLQKAIDMGTLPNSYKKTVQKAFDGFTQNAIQTQADEKQNIVYAPIRINLGENGGLYNDYIGVTKERNYNYAVAALIKTLIAK